jgi:formyltetrahydrofolate deformylase
MQIVITAVGPDNRGLADLIIHFVTGLGANIAEIQMYDHDELCVFAMLLRIELMGANLSELRDALTSIGLGKKNASRFASGRPKSERINLA